MKKKIQELQEDIERTSDMIVQLQNEQNKNLEEKSQMSLELKSKEGEIEEIKKMQEKLSKEHYSLLKNYENEKKKLRNFKMEADETKKIILNEIDSIKEQKDIVMKERKRLSDERGELKTMREELINLILVGKKARVLNQDKRMSFENPSQLNQDLSSISIHKFKDIMKTLKAEFEFTSI